MTLRTQSDILADKFHLMSAERSNKIHSEVHLTAKQFCAKPAADILDGGGCCLKPGRKGNITWDQNTFVIPQNHVPASVRITSELLSFIDDENITYINDFGAGVGQYKHAILSKHPNLKWNS